MALIKCRKCGQMVSDKADFCSVCGAPVAELDSTISSITEEPSTVTCTATIKANTNDAVTSKPSDNKHYEGKVKVVIYILAIILFVVGTVSVIAYINECARISEEEQARLEREEQARLVREEQGISSSKKVDLGLSVCWAGWNVGANAPEEYGDYFAWGEVLTKNSYTRKSYKYDDGSDYVYIARDICGTGYDVAYVSWGDDWRMPDKYEFQELLNECTWTWITCNGVAGYKVTGPNGNSIFLPASGCSVGTSNGNPNVGDFGCYWSGTLYDYSYNDNVDCAYFLSFHSNGRRIIEKYRCYGHTVRPVCNK